MRIFLPILVLTSILLGAGCVQTLSRFTPQEIDTTSWKTYTNALCGLSLKYPSDAVFSSQTESEAVITTQEDIDFQNAQDGEVPPSYYVGVSCKDLATVVRENGDNFTSSRSTITSLDEFFAKNTSSTIQKVGTAVVGGQPAIEAFIGADHHYSLWVSRDRVAVIDFSYAQSADALTAIQKAILGSVAFASF